jgi:SAM-dependent methyltransferase
LAELSVQDSTGSPQWNEYYQALEGRPLRDTLVRALDLFEADQEGGVAGFAIDLGCGSGNDTLEMLDRGWRVLAIDGEPESIARIQSIVPRGWLSRLQTRVNPFESIFLPGADLINASYSLPFCKPAYFDHLWGQIVGSLGSGGRFEGHFFGERDSWVSNPKRTFHSYLQLLELLAGFEIEYLFEEDRDGQTALGKDKHWHIFSVVACRKA